MRKTIENNRNNKSKSQTTNENHTNTSQKQYKTIQHMFLTQYEQEQNRTP